MTTPSSIMVTLLLEIFFPFVLSFFIFVESICPVNRYCEPPSARKSTVSVFLFSSVPLRIQYGQFTMFFSWQSTDCGVLAVVSSLVGPSRP
jgi:hypothetical protein